MGSSSSEMAITGGINSIVPSNTLEKRSLTFLSAPAVGPSVLACPPTVITVVHRSALRGAPGAVAKTPTSSSHSKDGVDVFMLNIPHREPFSPSDSPPHQ